MSSSVDFNEIRNARHIVRLKILIFVTVAVEGLFYYIPGPTLLDLIEKVFGSVANVTLIYCARAVGRIIGVLAGSFVFQWLLQSNHKSLFLFLTMLGLSVICMCLAITVAFDVMLILFGLSGLAMGIISTGINAICLHSFAHTSTFFCILSCFYSFGAFMSPVLARSFLKERVNITSETIDLHLINNSEVPRNMRNGYWTSLSYIYVILGALFFIVALLWLVYYTFAATLDRITEPIWVEKANITLWNLTILNASLMIFVSEAIAFAFPQILPSYLIINYQLSPVESLDNLMMFLGFFVIGRIVSIFLSTNYFCRTPPKAMLPVSIILIYGGVIVLYLDRTCRQDLFFTAQALIGIGVSPVFINTYLWLCCKIYITHRSMNPMFVMHSTAELIFPWILGKYAWKNPGNIKHFIAIVASIMILLYLIQYCFLFRASREACPDCELEAATRVLAMTVLQPISATAQTSQQKKRISLTDTDVPGVTSFKFENTVNILRDISELEKRVKRGNSMSKCAFKQLEYTVKL